MKKQFHSAYSLKYPQIVIYMLQRCEYEIEPFLKWFFRVENFNKISIRGELIKTSKSRFLLGLLNSLIFADILFAAYFISRGFDDSNIFLYLLGIVVFILYPLICTLVLTIPLMVARIAIVKPQQRRMIAKSRTIFKNTKALKIAVAGSYGKTSMKELLTTVLSESGIAAATPGNKNVAVSHAVFATKLSGDEKFIIVEFGEGQPGDVAMFTKTIGPDVGVITGIAPAHLDKYPNLDSAARDIFSLAKLLNHHNVYINGESEHIDKYLSNKDLIYSSKGIDGWRVNNVINGYRGISFELTKNTETIRIRSKLMGRHQIGPLSAVAMLARNSGLTIKQIEAGMAKTAPFEHRMELKSISGAYVLDDTYNGNLEGIKAGLNLLTELEAKRKIYVTPGLVDQGSETEKIHQEIGRLILKANPDRVVLMKNSVTDYILDGLGNYKGELTIETSPLRFYLNLDKILAADDLLLMQNDWPDNYN